VGLKYTDHNLYRMSEIARTGAAIFNGYDEVLAAGLLMGACGGIGTFYNVAPELFVSVYRSAREGRWSDARATQARINELITLAAPFSVLPAVKAILRWCGIACGQCIEPRGSLTPEREQSLRAALESSSFAALAAGAHR
jgi:N-acetylneuraminate lyase